LRSNFSIPLLQHDSSNDEYASWSFQKRERERENIKKKRGILLERSTPREMLFLAVSFVPSSHIFPFESSFLLGEKQAEEDERLVTLFYLVVVLVAEDGRKAEEREEE